jgi:putative transposase
MSVVEVEQSVIEPRAEEMPSGLDALDEQLLDQLVGRAKERGVKLAGERGLLAALTRRLLESALEGEITDHLGYAEHGADWDKSGNSRNGQRSKTVL